MAKDGKKVWKSRRKIELSSVEQDKGGKGRREK